MQILYFTATGNSLYVAKTLGGELLSIPQMVKTEQYSFEDKEIGIVFPVYSWSVPTYVADFLKKAQFRCEYLFGVATYGVYSGGVATHLQRIVAERPFDYIGKIKMVDNYLPGFDMDKQKKRAHKKNIEENLEALQKDIQQKKHFLPREHKLAIKTADSMQKLFLKGENPKNRTKSIVFHAGAGGITSYYSVDESCTQCGTCVKVCPVDNIHLNEKTISLENRCFMCLACVQNCPHQAIRLRGEMGEARFRNENIALREIIQSNQ